MELRLDSGKMISSAEFVQLLRTQDQKDKRFLRNRRIIPIAIGLILISAVTIRYPAFTPLMFLGGFLMFCGMLAALLLLLSEYHGIESEKYDTSLLTFILKKEKRLSYWRSTHLKYQVTYGLFVIGYIFLNIANPYITGKFGYIPFYILAAVSVIAHLLSEIAFRRRHSREHLPLLQIIEEIKSGLK